ncbi:zinc-dependent alcohol dehydrogenase family protein [soil metagenome]
MSDRLALYNIRMKAVIFERCGDPAEVLTIKDVPKPVPGRGEVLVRMIASPVNPSDLMYIRGVYGIKPKLPATPGFEGVGIVESSGGGLLGRLRKGKRVAVMNDRNGNWSEYTVTTAKQVIPVPDDIPDEQAASFFVNPATAVIMTQDVLKIPAGETLLQTAAGSALGSMIIRIAKQQGFKTINVVRRREQVEELKTLGADHVLVESDGPLIDQVKAIKPEGVKYALDPVGGDLGSQVVGCLAAYGQMLVYGALSGEATRVDPRFLITGSKSVSGFWLADYMKRLSIPQKLRLIRKVKRLLREGTITTPPGRSFPLDQVKEAVQAGSGGKVLLRIAS